MNGRRFISAILVLSFLATAVFLCITPTGANTAPRTGPRTLQGFTESSQGLPKNIEYVTIGVGRFNNDNQPDIAAGILSWMHANYGMDTWTNNNGAQSWTKQDTGLPTTGGYAQIAVGDLNGDGFDEIVAPHENAWSAGGTTGIAVYKSNGAANPTFSAMTSPTASGAWGCAALGDADKDGHLDVAASGETAGVKYWKGNGGTAWTDTSTGLPTTGQYYGVTFGDMNKDSNLDIIAAGNGAGLKVYLGNGGTSWSAATGTSLPGGQYLGVNISDVDNDGNPDIVVGGYQGGIEVWTGNGGSGGLSFTEESTNLVTSGFYGMVAVGDVDQDGNKDIWAGEAYGGGMKLYLGNGGSGGSCSWTSYTIDIPTSGPYTGALMVDVNQDGALDLIASDSGLNSGGSVGVRVFLSKIGNAPPIPRAGTDQTVLVGTTVHLDASNSSDVDGKVAGYKWNITSAPVGSTSTFNDSTVKTPTLLAQKIGYYALTLAVKDDKGKWGKWEAKVNITSNPWPNKRPVAEAGPDQNVKIFVKVQLNGSASWDDAKITAYKWNITLKPTQANLTLDNDKIVNPTFTPDYMGDYKFTLTVKDINNTWSKDDPVKVTVTPFGSGPPTANAGQPVTIELGQAAMLNGTASMDSKKVVLYHWTVTYQPPGSQLTVQDLPVQNITPTMEGSYDFSLMVKNSDNLWSLEPSTVRVTVVPRNLPPVVKLDKPADTTIFLSTDVVDFDGSASTDPEGHDLTFLWTSDKDGQLGTIATFSKNLSVGQHMITLAVTDDHHQTSKVSVNIEVKLDTLPTAKFTAKPLLLLKGEKVSFDGTASGDKEGPLAGYEFDFGDKTTLTWGTSPTVSHIYTSAGTYKTTLLVKDRKGQVGLASDPVTITVGERPNAAVTASLANVKVSKPVTLSANGSSDPDGKVVAYYFDYGDKTNSGWVNDSSVTKTYATAGSYTVTLKVKDELGFESVNSATVGVLVTKPETPATNGLGAMLLPILLIIIVVIVVVVLLVVLMKRKGKAAAQQAPAQVDLIQQPPPPSAYAGQDQTPPPPAYPQQYYPYDQSGQPPAQNYPYDQSGQPPAQNYPYDQSGQPPAQYYQGPGQQQQ